MTHAPVLLLSAAEMAELDRRTIEEVGLAAVVLMESAAWSCVSELLRAWPERVGKGVVVLCGPGNNGGDGLAMARRLAGLGIPTQAVLLADRGRLGEDAEQQAVLCGRVGVQLLDASTEDLLTELSQPWRKAGVVVDAVFGTGLTRPIEGVFARCVDAVREVREAGVPVLAVDIPSGVDASSGAILGSAVQASRTVTFAAAKRGHLLVPGRQQVGELVVADIGIPMGRWPELTDGAARLLGPEDLAIAVPEAPMAGHKGSFGHLLLVAGGPGKLGAARLAVMGALRAGAGLVTLALPDDLDAPDLPAEAMVERYRPGPQGAETITELLESRTALAIGPGLGTEASIVEMVALLHERAATPAVIDADGLNALASLATVPVARAPRVFTPHPGEMGRLVGSPYAAWSEQRVERTSEKAAEWGAVVVLKGAGTLVAEPEGAIAVNPTGNPGMGTGGSGDVLTGMLGALLARGIEAPRAARAAVYWHGLAGDVAGERLGQPSLTAGDLLDDLGTAWCGVRDRRIPPAIRRAEQWTR